MKRALKRIAVVTGLAIALAGCDAPAEWTSIYRPVPSDQAFLTDPKQRSILNVPAVGGPRQNIPTRIICAEPSPDVAQSVSSAISAALEVQIKGQGGGAASFGRSAADAVVQLGERLGTIQLLRDGLYRACEAYANGAINATTYAMIVSRYDDTMITLMYGELVAGAFGRAGAAAGAGASGAGQAGGGIDRETAMKSLKDADDKVAEKTIQLNDAQIELKKAKDQKKTDGTSVGPDDPNVKRNETAVKDKQQELEIAQRQRDNALEVLALSSSAGTFTSARALFASGQGGINRVPGEKAVAALQAMHRTFLEFDAIDLSPLIKACVTTLDSPTAPRETFVEELKTAAKAFYKAGKAFDEAEKSKKTEAKREYDAQRVKLQGAALNAGMTNLGVYCTANLLPSIMDLANKRLTKEQSMAQNEIKEMMDTAKLAAMKAQAAIDGAGILLSKTETATSKLTEELQGQSIEARTRRETLIDFCDDFLKNLTKESDVGAHETAKACFEALHGI